MLLIALVLFLIMLPRHQQSAIRLFPDTVNARSPDDWVIWDRQRSWSDYQQGLSDAFDVVNEGAPAVFDAVTRGAGSVMDLEREYKEKGGIKTAIDRLNPDLRDSIDRTRGQVKRAYEEGTVLGSIGADWYISDFNDTIQRQVLEVQNKHPGMSPRVTIGARQKMIDSFAPFKDLWGTLDSIAVRDKYDTGDLEALLPGKDAEAKRQNLLKLIAHAANGVKLLELVNFNAESKIIGQMDPLMIETTNALLDTQNANLNTLQMLFKLHYPGFWNQFAILKPFEHSANWSDDIAMM